MGKRRLIKYSGFVVIILAAFFAIQFSVACTNTVKIVINPDNVELHAGQELPELSITEGIGSVAWAEGYDVLLAGENDYKYVYTSTDGKTVTYTVTLTASDHETSYSYVFDDATCEELGILAHVCDICGEVYMYTSIAATGHSYTEEIYHEAANCQEYDYIEFACANCGELMPDPDNPDETYKEYTDIKGSCIWETTEDGEVKVYEVVAPTCTTSGSGYIKCTVCGGQEYVEIPAVDCEFTKQVLVVGTCQEESYYEYHCIYCDTPMTYADKYPDDAELAAQINDDGTDIYREYIGEYGEHEFEHGFCIYCDEFDDHITYDIGANGDNVILEVNYVNGENSSNGCNLYIHGSGDISSTFEFEDTDILKTSTILAARIEGEITSMPETMFKDAVSLEIVNFTDNSSMTSIPDGAFYGCSALKLITYPTSIETIGYKSFYECASLPWITLPDCLISVDEYAFYGNTNIEIVDLSNCTMLEEVGSYAFEAYGYLFAYLPNSTATRTANSFADYTSIIVLDDYNADISYNLCSTEYYTGAGITLDDITMDNGVVMISGDDIDMRIVADFTRTFYEYTLSGDILVSIPDTFSNAEVQSVFDEASNLVMIGSNALYNNRFITSLSIPDSVTNISDMAFYSATNLTEVDISEDSLLLKIGMYAFAYTSLESIYLPKYLCILSPFAFSYVSTLQEVYYNCQVMFAEINGSKNDNDVLSVTAYPDSIDDWLTTNSAEQLAYLVSGVDYYFVASYWSDDVLYDLSYSIFQNCTSTNINVVFGPDVWLINNNTFYDTSMIGSFDFSQATSLEYIFWQAINVTEQNVGSIDLSACTNLHYIDVNAFGEITEEVVDIFNSLEYLETISVQRNVTTELEWLDGEGLFTSLGSEGSSVDIIIAASVSALPENIFAGEDNYVNFKIYSSKIDLDTIIASAGDEYTYEYM